jgi:hypothetical protein
MRVGHGWPRDRSRVQSNTHGGWDRIPSRPLGGRCCWLLNSTESPALCRGEGASFHRVPSPTALVEFGTRVAEGSSGLIASLASRHPSAAVLGVHSRPAWRPSHEEVGSRTNTGSSERRAVPKSVSATNCSHGSWPCFEAPSCTPGEGGSLLSSTLGCSRARRLLLGSRAELKEASSVSRGRSKAAGAKQSRVERKQGREDGRRHARGRAAQAASTSRSSRRARAAARAETRGRAASHTRAISTSPPRSSVTVSNAAVGRQARAAVVVKHAREGGHTEGRDRIGLRASRPGCLREPKQAAAYAEPAKKGGIAP